MIKLNSKSKRILSLFLAVLMLTTSLPLTAFNAFALTWTKIASQNFSTAGEGAISEQSWQWNDDNNSNITIWDNKSLISSKKRYYYGWNSGNYFYDLPKDAGSSGMSWKSCIYLAQRNQVSGELKNKPNEATIAAQDDMKNSRPEVYARANSSSVNENGTFIDDGYLYLTQYGDNTGIPITGLDSFKIDVEFQVINGSSIPEKAKKNSYDSFTFMTLGKDTLSKVNAEKWNGNSYVFSQCASGKAYVTADSSDSMSLGYGSNVKNQYNDFSFADDNRNLNPDTDYHYVLSYSNDMLRGSIADDNGVIKVNLFAYRCSLNTNDIKSIVLGNDTNASNYLKSVRYKNITFYSGANDARPSADETLNKYVFAYFTGNDDERIRLAVSDDGYNFEALNGNRPILNNTPYTTYGTANNGGIPASGKARDPFIIRKQDENGFKDGYYVLATDLNISQTDYRNSKFLVWDVDKIENIGNIAPYNVETCDWFTGYNTLGTNPSCPVPSKDYYAWAPEAIWDNEKNQYMLYWSAPKITNGEGYNYLRIFCAYTDDFKVFYNSAGKEIGKNNVEPDILMDPGTRCIDANISYDGNLYYMYYKYEADGKIHFAVSEHANGPYVGNTTFKDSDYSDFKWEGCEVYQMVDGSYNFIVDCYKDGSNYGYMYDGYFLVYNSETIDGFQNNNQNAITNLNYLTPRHGSVAPISNAEYEALIAKYGKVTFDTKGIRDNSNVNDHLLARYFATENINEDATGNGNTLTSANLTFNSDATRDYVQFNANGQKASAYTSASYASVPTANMFSKGTINAKDGVTFDWYGTMDTNIWSNYFTLTTATSPGQTTPDGDSYYYNAQNAYGIYRASDKTQTTCWGWQNKLTSTNTWRHYTMSITDSYVVLFVDGKLLGKQYVDKGCNDEANRNGSNSSGSPTYSPIVNTNWFDNLFKNGTLYFGTSSWNDDMFTGKISDFRIYDKALSPAEIKISEIALADYLPGQDIKSADENRVYYDPMESTIIDGVRYDEYADTVDDPVTVKVEKTSDAPDVPVHGKVLKTNNGITSHYQFDPTTVSADTLNGKDEGVTISFGYNPSVSLQGTIFNIGETGTSGTNSKRYFTLLEHGSLYYKWEVDGVSSSYEITDVFQGKLQPNLWQHITIQIEPTGSYETIYIYINSALVSKIKSRQYSDTVVKGRGLYDFFTNPSSSNNGGVHNVYYGKEYGYGWADGAGFMDDFCIYNGLITPDSSYVQASLDKIDTFIPRSFDLFKEKMTALPDLIKNENAVYSNIGLAYEMYDKINRYLDSVAYGDVQKDSGILAKYYVEFRSAMNKMESYVEPTSLKGIDNKTTFFNTSIDPKFTQNLLTTPSLNRGKELNKGTQNELNVAIYSSSFVWLYDGVNTPTAPINGAVYAQRPNDVGQVGYFYNIYVNDQIADSYNDIAFGGLGYGGNNDGYWHMTQRYVKTDNDWYYDNYYKNIGSVKDAKDNYLTYSGNTGLNPSGDFVGLKQAWIGGSNYLTYNGTVPEDSYQVSFTPSYRTQLRREWTFGGNDNYDFDIAPVGKIYVINYVPVRNALHNSDVVKYLSNITNYSPAFAKELISAYDALTGQEYMLNDANAAAVNSLAATLEDGVNRLLGLKDQWNTDLAQEPDKYNMADYTNLIDTADTELKEIAADKASGLEGKYDENTSYTQSSWKAYTDSVDNVKDHFNSLNPEDRNQPYAVNQHAVDGMVDDISESKRKLVIVADYEPVDSAVTDYADDYNNGIGTGYEDQKWTLSSYFDFADAYDSAKNLSENGDRVDVPRYNTALPYDSQDPSTWTVKSDSQINIDNTGENADAKHARLAAVDDVSAYEAYNKAQSLFAMADQEAYTDQAKTVLNSWGSTSSAQPYTRDIEAVYVEYNGAIYKNTGTYTAEDGTLVNETDNYTRRVLTTINGGDESTADSTGDKTRVPYTVTFNVYEDGQLISSDVSTHYYGEIVPLSYTGTGKVVTWRTQRKDCDETFIKNTSNSYSVKIQSDSTIDVYASTADCEYHEVQVLDHFGRAQVTYVRDGSTASVNGDTITFSDGTKTSITNKPCNYIEFTGFTVDNKPVTGDIVINSDIKFVAAGNKAADTLDYTVEGGTFADGTTQQRYKLDDVITITAATEDCAGIAIKTKDGWTMLTYDSEYTIFAFPAAKAFNGKVEFKVMTSADNIEGIAPQSFGVGVYANNKLSMYCTMTTGLKADQVKIIERGVIAATSPDNLIKGADGVKTFRSSTDIKDAQYLFTINNKSGNPLYARSYVCYELKYDENTNIPLVAYGEIVASDAC